VEKFRVCSPEHEAALHCEIFAVAPAERPRGSWGASRGGGPAGRGRFSFSTLPW